MNKIVQQSCNYCHRFSAWRTDRCPHCNRKKDSMKVPYLILLIAVSAAVGSVIARWV